MVLKRMPSSPALVVPDEETWLAFADDDAHDLEPTTEPGRARVLLLPERVPDGLVEAVQRQWALMPEGRAARTYEPPFPGASARDALEQQAARRGEHEGREDDEGHGEHDGHDHEDMMSITGEPSADGLVMEDLHVEAGPLGVALPGGLVVSATLDGDVVADCQVRQTLRVAAGGPPDPWAAVAWGVAELSAKEADAGVAARLEQRWFRLAAVEVERAVDHLAWLHRFCRLLGWHEMTARVRGVLVALTSARRLLPVELTAPDLPDGARHAVERLGAARAAVEMLAADIARSRRFARRTSGLGQLRGDDVARRGLAGPVARASGVPADARSDDAGYRALGFSPVARDEGDARARALVRAAEAVQSAALAATAIERAGDHTGAEPGPSFGDRPGAVVEAARGPVRVLIGATGEPERTAPGARVASEVAAGLAVGREWAAALVTIASFDISPWKVGP